jgi:hypothetical protein
MDVAGDRERGAPGPAPRAPAPSGARIAKLPAPLDPAVVSTTALPSTVGAALYERPTDWRRSGHPARLEAGKRAPTQEIDKGAPV